MGRIPDDQEDIWPSVAGIYHLSLSPEASEADRILNGDQEPAGGWSKAALDEARRMHWSRITSSLDPSPMAAPTLHASREEAVMWRLDCPACSAKLALFGIDFKRKGLHSDEVWMHPYRRVHVSYHGIDESYEEGQYQAFVQVRLKCGTPQCRGFEKYRLETIVRRMHGLRQTQAPGTVITRA